MAKYVKSINCEIVKDSNGLTLAIYTDGRGSMMTKLLNRMAASRSGNVFYWPVREQDVQRAKALATMGKVLQ
jgi:hypothetical protein